MQNFSDTMGVSGGIAAVLWNPAASCNTSHVPRRSGADGRVTAALLQILFPLMTTLLCLVIISYLSYLYCNLVYFALLLDIIILFIKLYYQY